MTHSKPTRAPVQARKPRPDFPLFPHATSRWAKKVRGRLVYFGTTRDDPDGERALTRWLEQRDELLAGRTPRPKADGLTLRELLDRYMVSKRHLLDTREISPKHFAELYATCRQIGDAFGMHRLVMDLGPADFEQLRKAVAKRWGPVRLGNEIQRIRSVFKFALESGLIDKPTLFGPGFKKPSRKVLRQNRAKSGLRLFEAAEVRAILDAASQPLRAMILLGVNCGFGNSDVANLPMKALDLEREWVTFPRPKTGVERRCPLWPETVAAIRDALAQRPRHKSPDDTGIVFITSQGHRWEKTGISEPGPDGKIRVTGNVPVTAEFRKLLNRLGVHRPKLGFYTLRHTFRTVADATRDFPAIRSIMGHVDDTMDNVYRETIGDDRLQAVTAHVHRWLFGAEATD